jgi:hypothetical protein
MPAVAGEVIHIVLFQWRPEASAEAIEQALEALRALKDKIPGILDLSCGANFTDRGKNFTHALLLRLKDQAALEGYGPHPEHQKVVQEIILPIRADLIAIDYFV